MKLSSKTKTADIFEDRLRRFQELLFNYEPGDLDTLCELAETVVRGYEYWITSRSKPVLNGPYQAELKSWFRTHFSNQVCLVLENEGRIYSYTRRYILKKLRGIGVHSDQNDRDEKDKIFRKFVFEEDKPSFYGFAVTHCWLITGGIVRDTGNTDSSNPFRERVKLNEREIIVSTLESLVISVYVEFWFTLQEGSYYNAGRLLFQTDLGQLQERFGKNIGKDCYDTVQWHLSKNDKIT